MTAKSQRFHFGLIPLIFFVFSSCSSNEPGPPLYEVSNIVTSDNANNGNASDIEVNFDESTFVENTEEYRVFLIPESGLSSFDLEFALMAGPEMYTAEIPEEVYPVQGIVLNESQLDTEGNAITDGQNYYTAVLTVSKNRSKNDHVLNISETIFSLSVNPFIEDHTSEMSVGAGSLVALDDQLFMGDYNVFSEFEDLLEGDFVLKRIERSGSNNDFVQLSGVMGGNSITSQGEVVQSLTEYGIIVKIDPQGIQTTLLESDKFLYDGVFVNANDEIFLVEKTDHQLLQLNSDGTTTLIAELPENPRGLTGDENGNFYVSHNSEEGIISKITSNGTVSTFATIPTYVSPNYLVEFFMWLGYITYHNDALYVVGTSVHTIYRIDMNGNVERFIGTEDRGVPRGDIRTAKLNRPMGIAISANGDFLYFSGGTDTHPSHTQYSVPSKIYKVNLLD